MQRMTQDINSDSMVEVDYTLKRFLSHVWKAIKEERAKESELWASSGQHAELIKNGSPALLISLKKREERSKQISR